MQFEFVEKLVKEAAKSHASWELWIPGREKSSLDSRVTGLKVIHNKLEARRADFVFAQRVEEEQKGASSTAAATNMVPLSIVRIKPIGLPRFHGCKRDFHRWKRDWETLQKQG